MLGYDASQMARDMYESARRERLERYQEDKAVRDAALSGGAGGGALGAVYKILGGSRDWRSIASKSLLGALAGGALSGGATDIGTRIMGAPEEEEDAPFAERGGLGGIVGGGVVGATLGGAMGAGALGSLPQKLPNNLFFDPIKKFAQRPSGRSAALSALVGGGLLGGLAGYQGAGEGMQVDFLRNSALNRKKNQLEQLREEGMI